MNSTISLIIPVYNVEKYLEQCLDSVAGQSEPFDEVILVNDGSTDNSRQICERYVEKYSCFSLVDQQNKGLSAARNHGLCKAKSDYIMFLDSDDFICDNTVEILKKILSEKELDAVYFDSEVFFDGYEQKKYKDIEDRGYMQFDNIVMSGWEYFGRSYPRAYMIPVWAAVYKKDIIISNNIQFPDGIYYEDNYFTFLFLNNADNTMHISRQFHKRRYRTESIITSMYSERKFKDYIKCVYLIWNYIKDLDCRQLHEKRILLQQFVSDHYDSILNNYCDCRQQHIELQNEAVDMLHGITEQYIKLLNMLEFDISSATLANLVMVMKNFYRILQYDLKPDTMTADFLPEIGCKQEIYYKQVLEQLPLDRCGIKVGIYGTGNHTEGLLAIYGRLVGDIKCDLVFIDSYKDNGVYMNSPLVNYKKINQSYDCIIISSFLYEQEMIQNIKSLNMDIPVYRFYKDISTDIFSNYRILLRYI